MAGIEARWPLRNRKRGRRRTGAPLSIYGGSVGEERKGRRREKGSIGETGRCSHGGDWLEVGDGPDRRVPPVGD